MLVSAICRRNWHSIDEAIQSYTRSIAAYDEALRRAHDFVKIRNNRGLTLAKLGELQVSLLKSDEGIKNFEAALAEFSRTLEIAPGFAPVRDLRDLVQKRIDELRGT